MTHSEHNILKPKTDAISPGKGFVVLIAAAGSGDRMKNNIPKQFMPLAGKPLLMHTLQQFIDFDLSMRIILALPPANLDYWQQLCREYDFRHNIEIIEGGKTRFETVGKGLEYITESEYIAVHDGARPFAGGDLLERCFMVCREKGNAIPFIASKDSVRLIRDGKNSSLQREEVALIQTPQCFTFEILVNAFTQSTGSAFTDEASLVENAGNDIYLVEGDEKNIKITHPNDFLIAESLITRKRNK